MSADEYRFRLFIAGNEPNSHLAEQNLRALTDTASTLAALGLKEASPHD